MSTISGTITHGISLSASGSYTSPLTITAAGSVSNGGTGDAIYGSASQAWQVVNYGTVSATGTYDGIDLKFGAIFGGNSIDNTGLVIGGNVGVYGGYGGTITNAGTIVGNSGTAVSVGERGKVIVDPGAEFLGSGGSTGTIAIGQFGELELAGTTAGTFAGLQYVELTNATVYLAQGSDWTLAGNNTIASGVNLNVASGFSGHTTLAVTGTLVNDGDFSSFSYATISAAAVDSTGLMSVGAYNEFTISGTLFNSGQLTVGGGIGGSGATLSAAALDNTGSLTLYGDLRNPGSGLSFLDIAGAAPATLAGAIDLFGDAQLQFGSGSITAIGTGASLELAGRDNLLLSGAGSALAELSVNDGKLELLAGSYRAPGASTLATNAGVDLTNAGFLYVGAGQLSIGGTLYNSGTIRLGDSYGGSLNTISAAYVTAAALDSTGLIELAGSHGETLAVAGAAPTTLEGTVTLISEGTASALLEFGSGAIKTIASGAHLYLAGGIVASAGNTTTDSGFALSDNAGYLNIEAVAGGAAPTLTAPGNFTNSGSILLDTGVFSSSGTLVGGSSLGIAGTLINSGYMYIGQYNTSAASDVTAAALANTGKIRLSAQGTMSIAGAAPATLAGTAVVNAHGLLEFGSGAIETIASGAELSLAGGFVALSGSPTVNSALTSLSSNLGSLIIGYHGETLTTGVDLTNSGAIDVSGNSAHPDLLSVGGTIYNSGDIALGSYGTVTGAALADSGAWTISVAEKSLLEVAGAAPATLTGTLDLGGTSHFGSFVEHFAGGTLEFGSGSIETIAAGAYLDMAGAGATVAVSGGTVSNGLESLSANLGTIVIEEYRSPFSRATLTSPATVSTGVNFDNSGLLEIDPRGYQYSRAGEGGSTLAIGGTLQNSGTVIVGNNYLSGQSTLAASGLTNTGTIALDGYSSNFSTLRIAGPVTNSGRIVEFGNGEAIYLTAAGTIDNQTAGYIGSTNLGIKAEASATITNAGTIIADGQAISFREGGSLDNAGGGTISANSGVYGRGTAALDVTNAGTIHVYGTFADGVGIYGNPGGSIDNTGLIEAGGADGIGVDIGSHGGTVTNSGTIEAVGTSGKGVVLNNYGSVGGLTATNSGTIVGGSGSNGRGVVLGRGYLDNLAGGTITSGGAGVYGYGYGTFAHTGTVVNAGVISGGSFGIEFKGSPGDTGTVIDSGTISGATAILFAGTGGNLLVLEHGYAISGAVVGGVSAGATNTLELSGSLGAVTVGYQGFTHFQTVEFGAAYGNAERLKVSGTSGTLGPTIAGFTATQDKIDLTQLGTFVSDRLNGDLLTVTGANGSVTLDFSSLPGGFAFGNDGAGGTLVEVACFRRGTRIMTENGEYPVEELSIGDRVATLAGEIRAIKWIGRRSYKGAFLVRNGDLWPILVKKGALADGVPRRDLYISPHHALFLDGLLIPAECLVNGSSILRCACPEELEYFHIELSTHDVILAEGAPAETFVDCDDRGIFHNACEFALLYPGEAPPRWAFCAPRVEAGRELEAVRRRLIARASRLFPTRSRAA